MTKRVFITGSESFVGKELIKQCKPTEFELHGCDNMDPSDSRFIKADIREENISELIPMGIDVIIHLAALSSDPQCRNKAYECFDVHVMGTLNLIEAAEKRKCKQIIFASSEWVYDNFLNDEEKTENSIINIANLTSEYALSKLVSEANLRQKYQHGFCDTTILRFGIIYGSRKKNWSAVESIFNAIKNEDQAIVGSLKTGRCFVHVSDIVKGIMKSIGLKGFNIVGLEGSELTTLDNVIKTSKRILGKDITIVEKDAGNMSVRRVSADKAKEKINWQTEIGLEEGLKDLNKIL